LPALGNQVKEATYNKSVIRNIPWSPSYASLVHISGDSLLTELPNSWRLFRDRATADIVASHLQRHNVQRSSTTPTRGWFRGYRDCRRAGDVHPNPGPHQEHRLGRPAQEDSRKRPQRVFADQPRRQASISQITQNGRPRERMPPTVLVVGSHCRYHGHPTQPACMFAPDIQFRSYHQGRI